MPTFTDLYYTVGGYKADKYLKPEEMQALEAGLKYLNPGVRATLSLYWHHGTNMIDWIKDLSEGADAPWQSVNHTKVNTLGAEAAVTLDMATLTGKRQVLVRTLNVAYSYINKDKEAEAGIQSLYALDYLRHKVVAQANLHLYGKLNMNLSYRWQERRGNYEKEGVMVSYQPYSLLDARLSWDDTCFTVYAEANNLLNKTYYDYGNIPQPGIWVRAGASFRF